MTATQARIARTVAVSAIAILVGYAAYHRWTRFDRPEPTWINEASLTHEDILRLTFWVDGMPVERMGEPVTVPADGVFRYAYEVNLARPRANELPEGEQTGEIVIARPFLASFAEGWLSTSFTVSLIDDTSSELPDPQTMMIRGRYRMKDGLDSVALYVGFTSVSIDFSTDPDTGETVRPPGFRPVFVGPFRVRRGSPIPSASDG